MDHYPIHKLFIIVSFLFNNYSSNDQFLLFLAFFERQRKWLMGVVMLCILERMESDWSSSLFTGEDDFIQSYEQYNVTSGYNEYDNYDLNGVDNDYYCENENENEGEELQQTLIGEKRKIGKSIENENKLTSLSDLIGIYSENSSSVATRNSSKKKSKKSKKRKIRRSPTEMFYEIILSWKVNRLLGDERKLLQLPELVAQSSYFKSIIEYCDLQQQLPIEESRVSLLKGIQSPEDYFYASYNGGVEDIDPSHRGLHTLVFEVRNSYELMKPGWIYLAFPEEEEEEEENFNSSTRSYHRKKSNRSSLSNQLMVNFTKCNGNCLSLSLALGKSQYQLNSTSNSSPNAIVVWVHFNSLQPYLQEWKNSTQFPLYWKFYPLQNIITNQRMYVACQDVPNLPFMRKFLGQKQPTHVVFDDSDVEDGADGVDIDEDSTEDGNNQTSNYNISGINPNCLRYSTVLDKKQLLVLNTIYESVKKSKVGQTCDFLHLIQGPPGMFDTTLTSSSLLLLLPRQLTINQMIGCGKTHFLAHLLDALISNFDLNESASSSPCTALVCAPSNKAISVVVEKYFTIIPSNSWKYHPLVLVGVQEKLESCSKSSSSSSSSSQQSVFSEESIPNSQFNLQQMTHELKEIFNMTTERKEESYPTGLLPSSLISLLATITTPTSSTDCLIYTYPQRYSSLFLAISIVYTECINQLEILQFHSTPFQILIIAILDNITLEYYDLNEVLHLTTPSFYLHHIKCHHQQIVNTLQSLSFEINELLENCSLLHFEKLKTHLDALQQTFNTVADHFLKFSQEYWRDLLDHAAVICSTLSSSGNSLMKSCHNVNKSIDILIVDEAGQCLESELLIPFYVNPNHLVLIGDPKQLPATVLSYQAQQLHLGDSSLYRLMYKCNTSYHMLTTQYRMHPEICLFPNRQFYNNQLQTAVQVNQRQDLSQYLSLQQLKRNELSPGRCHCHHHCASHCRSSSNSMEWFGNYLWINVNGDETTGGSFGKSRANVTEATVVARLVSYLTKQMNTSLHDHLGIITFYSAQVHQIKKSLHQYKIPNSSHFHVMSVDGFQGSEKDIIIVSFVRSNDRSEVGFVQDFQRLNVSLTRAKYLLILIGCLETFEYSQSKDLQNLIYDVKLRNRVYSYEKFNEFCQ